MPPHITHLVMFVGVYDMSGGDMSGLGLSESTCGPELVLNIGVAANGGSCIARYDGRVVFVRYALPGERVRAVVTRQHGSYWHADAIEVLEASPDRIDPLCSVAGNYGGGCCDLCFVDPVAARVLKGQVVAHQLTRLGGYEWDGVVEPLSNGHVQGWRTRVRLGVDAAGRPGFYRFHSSEIVTDVQCAQLPDGMLEGLDQYRFTPGAKVHVVVDDDDQRHVVCTTANPRRTWVVEGDSTVVRRVGDRMWTIPATVFWQAHRDAASTYSALVDQWMRAAEPVRAWDLYGGTGLFAAVLAAGVGAHGHVVTVDTARPASRCARVALADCRQVHVVTDSVRRFLSAQRDGADIAVLDPPRSGAGREVIAMIAAAGISKIIHIGCEVAAFSRDIGLYTAQGYEVETLRVFDSFPLTHHVECIAVLKR